MGSSLEVGAGSSKKVRLVPFLHVNSCPWDLGTSRNLPGELSARRSELVNRYPFTLFAQGIRTVGDNIHLRITRWLMHLYFHGQITLTPLLEDTPYLALHLFQLSHSRLYACNNVST